MAIVFEDDFNSEVVGTSPPANWELQGAFTLARVSDAVPKYVGDNAFQIRQGNNANWIKHNLAADTTETYFAFKLRTTRTDGYWYMYLQATAGAQDITNATVGLLGRNDGSVRLYDGTTLTDTGRSYAADTWHTAIVILNYAAHTFTLSWDGVVTGPWGFYAEKDVMRSIQLRSNTINTPTLYLDDFQLGEASGRVHVRFDNQSFTGTNSVGVRFS